MQTAEDTGDHDVIERAQAEVEGTSIDRVQLSILLAETYKLCPDWDTVNPIFAEKDGGDESLRTGTSHGGDITLRAFEENDVKDNAEDDDDEVTALLGALPDSQASTHLLPIPPPLVNRFVSPSTATTRGRQSRARDIGVSEQETLSVRASESQEQRHRRQAR